MMTRCARRRVQGSCDSERNVLNVQQQLTRTRTRWCSPSSCGMSGVAAGGGRGGAARRRLDEQDIHQHRNEDADDGVVKGRGDDTAPPDIRPPPRQRRIRRRRRVVDHPRRPSSSSCRNLRLWSGLHLLVLLVGLLTVFATVISSGVVAAFVRQEMGPSNLLLSEWHGHRRSSPSAWPSEQVPYSSVTAAFTRHAVRLLMGKGDGKTRKPKKTASSPTSSSSSPPALSSAPAPMPRRVSSNINVPVRHQIMMAQLNKQLQRAAADGPSGSFRRKVERTSYRRTWDEEEILEKAEERKRKGQDPDWDVILSRNATLPPLLIVDGYNIIHKWSRLKKHMVKGDLAKARQLLVDDLEDLASLKGWRIEVVFDGGQRRLTTAASSPAAALRIAQNGGGGSSTAATPLAERAATKEISKHGVRVVYTGSGVEADSYIESRCANAKDVTSGKITGSFLVATDDQMVRMAGMSAGAMCMGADRLVTELKAVRQSVAYRVEAAVAAVNGHVMRPDALKKTPTAASGTNAAATAAAAMALRNRRFGRGSVVIEDKRKLKEERKKRKSSEDNIPDLDIKIEVDVDENGIPWWAKVPNQTHTYKR